MNQAESLATILRETERACGLKPLAPVTWCGLMTSFDGVAPLRLWNLDEPVWLDGLLHPIGDTVSEDTLRRNGWALPNRKVN